MTEHTTASTPEPAGHHAERALQLGGYVTDALDPAERQEFVTHLAACHVCTEEAAMYAESLAELSYATQETPPRHLRDSVLGAIAAVTPLPALDPEQPGDRADDRSQPGSVTRLELVRARKARRVLTMAVAAALVAVLALGGWVVTLRQQEQQRQQLAATEADLLAAPDARVLTTTMQDGSHASYVISRSQNRALFVGADVAGLPSGRVYQLWTSPNGTQFHSAGTFSGSGQQWVVIRGDVATTRLLAITVEARNGGRGAAAPTVIPGVQPFAVQQVPA